MAGPSQGDGVLVEGGGAVHDHVARLLVHSGLDGGPLVDGPHRLGHPAEEAPHQGHQHPPRRPSDEVLRTRGGVRSCEKIAKNT